MRLVHANSHTSGRSVIRLQRRYTVTLNTAQIILTFTNQMNVLNCLLPNRTNLWLIRLLIINCLQHYQVNGLSYRLSKTLDLHDLGSTDYQLHSIFASTIFYSRVSILGIQYVITGLIKSTVDICIYIIVIILHKDELPACFKFQLRLVEQKNSKYSLAVWIT
jgi:hypothetical protein